VDEMVAAYRQRRDAAADLLGRAGLLAARPRGTFYVLARIDGASADTFAFVRRLLEAERVAVAPGETFGPGGEGLVRLSLASSTAAIAAGIDALVRVSRSRVR
jgi:aspartate/methionine/tyrosine aminotransferase